MGEEAKAYATWYASAGPIDLPDAFRAGVEYGKSALTAEIAALRLEKDGSADVANSGAPSAPSETWRLVPVEPTPEIVARVAVQTELPSMADFAVAAEALKLAPQTDHPDARTILAEIARDYRHAIAARPLPLGASKGVTPGSDKPPRPVETMNLFDMTPEQHRECGCGACLRALADLETAS